jgi:hypothetical protein
MGICFLTGRESGDVKGDFVGGEVVPGLEFPIKEFKLLVLELSPDAGIDRFFL